MRTNRNTSEPRLGPEDDGAEDFSRNDQGGRNQTTLVPSQWISVIQVRVAAARTSTSGVAFQDGFSRGCIPIQSYVLLPARAVLWKAHRVSNQCPCFRQPRGQSTVRR
jgi:hypothetical protein